jgi:hypothetical protein
MEDEGTVALQECQRKHLQGSTECVTAVQYGVSWQYIDKAVHQDASTYRSHEGY